MGVALAIFLGVVPAFVYALFVYWLDRYEKEPIILLGGVFIWGAVVATGGAFIINTLFGVTIFAFTDSASLADTLTASVSAPLVEETLKGLAVLIVFLLFRKEFDNLLDGVVYAGIAALGFAATENAFYIWNYGVAEGGIADIVMITFIRNVWVGWQHPFYTSFIGIGLAIARLNKNWLIRIGAPVAGWSLAVFTHSVHNSMSVFIGDVGGFFFGALVDWTGWAFMFGLIIWFISRERNFMKLYLKSEVERGVITKQQYKTLQSSLAVSLARFGALTAGKGRYAATRKFYQKCAELAHKKRQHHKLEEDKAVPTIERLRNELSQLSPRALT